MVQKIVQFRDGSLGFHKRTPRGIPVCWSAERKPVNGASGSGFEVDGKGVGPGAGTGAGADVDGVAAFGTGGVAPLGVGGGGVGSDIVNMIVDTMQETRPQKRWNSETLFRNKIALTQRNRNTHVHSYWMHILPSYDRTNPQASPWASHFDFPALASTLYSSPYLPQSS